MSEHWKRLWWAILGNWSPDFDPNAKPPKNRRGYLGEIGHSAKNVVVEWFREVGIWNRGGKTKPHLPYEWPESL